MKLKTYMLTAMLAKAIEGPGYLAIGFFGALGLEKLVKWAWRVI